MYKILLHFNMDLAMFAQLECAAVAQLLYDKPFQHISRPPCSASSCPA
jgi:hypothetical protein